MGIGVRHQAFASGFLKRIMIVRRLQVGSGCLGNPHVSPDGPRMAEHQRGSPAPTIAGGATDETSCHRNSRAPRAIIPPHPSRTHGHDLSLLLLATNTSGQLGCLLRIAVFASNFPSSAMGRSVRKVSIRGLGLPCLGSVGGRRARQTPFVRREGRSRIWLRFSVGPLLWWQGWLLEGPRG